MNTVDHKQLPLHFIYNDCYEYKIMNSVRKFILYFWMNISNYKKIISSQVNHKTFSIKNYRLSLSYILFRFLTIQTT